ncbi:MAG TPA: gamma-glutamylcyclotransferase family protein [Dyadobacter sp.]|jgi:gamma-glutamylcyclotransferase (GGCT)/AIG2-like uncharacterized protein YtfP|nr:gamma-glutamylcyclotransferase family protein [Dyadobacter sp.]
MTSDYLFVYGTLMQGFNNPFAEKLRQSASFEGYGRVAGILYQITWYPGAIYLPDASATIYGEIYKLAPNTGLLAELDEYEDVCEDQGLYRRIKVPVLTKNERTIHCWIYVYNQSVGGLRQIESGDFRDPA